MYARITIFSIPPERVDEGVELYRKSVLPDAKKQKGYCGDFLLFDPRTGKGNSITFWKSEKDALATEANLYYQEQLTKFLTFFVGPVIREGYDVYINTFAHFNKKKSTKKAKS